MLSSKLADLVGGVTIGQVESSTVRLEQQLPEKRRLHSLVGQQRSNDQWSTNGKESWRPE